MLHIEINSNNLNFLPMANDSHVQLLTMHMFFAQFKMYSYKYFKNY